MSFLLHLCSKKRRSPSSIFLSTLSVPVNQGMLQKPEGAKEYFLLARWLLLASFICNFYSAVLLSFLSFPQLKGVKTIPELSSAVSRGDRWCATYPGGYATNLLLHSQDPDLQIIGQSLEQNPGSYDIDYVLQNTTPHKPVFIGGRGHFERLKHRYFVADDIFMSSLVSVAFQKDFCCVKKLDEVIHHLWASGIIHKITVDEGFRIELAKSHNILAASNSNERQLTLYDLGGAFVFLAASHVLALFVFLIEILVERQNLESLLN